jgi:uncharacterized protein YdaU (DUF1376 family)
MTKSDSYYLWYPGDYARDTASLSLTEDGAYRRLLDTYYAEKTLPSDKERLFTICRVRATSDEDAVNFVVGRFFRKVGERLVNKRADMEIEKRQLFIDAQSEKGKRGADVRWGAEYADSDDGRGTGTGTGTGTGKGTGPHIANQHQHLRSKTKTTTTPSPHAERAEKIVEYYEEIVREDRSSRARAQRNVLKLLTAGADPHVLWKCVEMYSDDVEKEKREMKYRKVAGNFFGRDADYVSYQKEAKEMKETTLPFAGKGK